MLCGFFTTSTGAWNKVSKIMNRTNGNQFGQIWMVFQEHYASTTNLPVLNTRITRMPGDGRNMSWVKG